MTFGAETWGPPLVQAAASAAAAYFGGKGAGKEETKMQKTKRKLVDQLLASLNGQGPFSDLYNPSEDLFQKSFVEPAMSKFRNQTAPQIQQQYIASGQQRGTGLDDTLTRAGVDMDQMLNQQMYQFYNDADNRKVNSINSILGGSEGAKRQPTDAQNLMSGASGYLSSQGFADTSADLFKKYLPADQGRKGFEKT